MTTDIDGQVRVRGQFEDLLAGEPARCLPPPSTSAAELASSKSSITRAPGTVVEGVARSWRSGAMQVYDCGEEGLVSTSLNELFAT